MTLYFSHFDTKDRGSDQKTGGHDSITESLFAYRIMSFIIQGRIDYIFLSEV